MSRGVAGSCRASDAHPAKERILLACLGDQGPYRCGSTNFVDAVTLENLAGTVPNSRSDLVLVEPGRQLRQSDEQLGAQFVNCWPQVGCKVADLDEFALAPIRKKDREPDDTLWRLSRYSLAGTTAAVVPSCRICQASGRLSRLSTMTFLRPSISNERRGTCYFAGQPAISLPAHPLRL
jgi:hypothetical protein